MNNLYDVVRGQIDGLQPEFCGRILNISFRIVDLGAILTVYEGEDVIFEESIIGENPIQEISKLLSWHDRDRDDDILETLDNCLYDEYLGAYDPDNPENWKEEKQYRGIVKDDLNTMDTRKTKWYSTYKEAHEAAEVLHW